MIAAVSSRSHWAVSKTEADSIAAPLETVLADLSPDQIKIVEKYTAPAVLLMATAGVVVPRVMIDLNGMNLQKKRKIHNVTIKNEPEPIPSGNDGGNVGGGTAPADDDTFVAASPKFASHIFDRFDKPM